MGRPFGLYRLRSYISPLGLSLRIISLRTIQPYGYISLQAISTVQASLPSLARAGEMLPDFPQISRTDRCDDRLIFARDVRIRFAASVSNLLSYFISLFISFPICSRDTRTYRTFIFNPRYLPWTRRVGQVLRRTKREIISLLFPAFELSLGLKR